MKIKIKKKALRKNTGQSKSESKSQSTIVEIW